MAGSGKKDLKTLLDTRSLADSINDLSRWAADYMNIEEKGGACIVGIKTGGEVVARRIVKTVSGMTGIKVPLGVIDINLYRDDIGQGRKWPEVKGTEMPFSVDGLDVLIVDDVIFTGRTARAAIEAVTDYGRPSRISLAVIADRGGREFPIQPDYRAIKVNAGKNRKVVLRIGGTDDGPEGLFVRESGRL